MIKEDLANLADELAGAGPAPDLADRAVRGAARRHRRHLLGVAGVTALAVAALPAVVWILPTGGGPPPADTDTPALQMASGGNRWTEPRPGGGPQAIQAYVYDPRAFVLNPRTARYDELPAADVFLSPDGTKVALTERGEGRYPFFLLNGRVGLADRAQLADRGAGAIRWTDTRTGFPSGLHWSPDSKKFLVRVSGAGAHDRDRSKMRIIDAGTGNGRDLEIPANEPYFAADSEHVIGHISDGGVSQLAYFSLDGVRTRTVALGPWTFAQDIIYSPDGTRAIVDWNVHDAVTWRPVTGTLLDIDGWYSADKLVQVKPDKILVIRLDGTIVKVIPVAPTGRNRMDSNWPHFLRKIQVRSSANLSGAATQFGF
jgi:hypothetical protein